MACLLEKTNGFGCPRYLYLNLVVLIHLGGEGKMNKRIRKKKEKELLIFCNKIKLVCKKIKWLDGTLVWRSTRGLSHRDYDDLDEIQAINKLNRMLYKVVKRCYEEKFPIQEYMVFEIPYRDKDGWIIDFVHMQDYSDYHYNGMKAVEMRCIDFEVPYKGVAIPLRLEGCNQYECKTCKEAVYQEENYRTDYRTDYCMG